MNPPLLMHPVKLIPLVSIVVPNDSRDDARYTMYLEHSFLSTVPPRRLNLDQVACMVGADLRMRVMI